MVQSETLKPPITNFAALLAFPIALLLVLWTAGTDAWRLKLGDPDNYGRLVQVRDWLNGQGWWDIVQHRVNPPTGLDTHWSRIADVPIAALIELADLFTTRATAEQIAVTILPLLYLMLAMALIGHIASRLAGTIAAIIAGLMASISIYTLSQFGPGRIDHHGLQIVLALGMSACLIGQDSFRNGLAAALLTALSLSVGLETLPYLAVAGFWVASRWAIRGTPVKTKTLGYLVGITLFTPALLALTRMHSDWLKPQHDALSIAQASIAITGCASFALLMKASANEMARSRYVTVLFAALAAAIPLIYFRASFAAPYSEVEANLREVWLGNISETRSFFESWDQGPIAAVGEVLFPFLSAIAAMFLFRRARGTERDRVALAGLLVLVGLALTLWQIRTRPLAYAFALPIASVAIIRAREKWKQSGGSIAPFATLAFALNPVLPLALSKATQNALSHSTPTERQADGVDRSCDEPSLYLRLASLPRGLVVSPIDLSNRILARTSHDVVSSPIHRNAVANGAAYHALLAPPALARRRLDRLRAEYVVFCSTANETENLTRRSPGGLLAILRQGNSVDWLRSTEGQSSSKLKVYIVAGDDHLISREIKTP